MKLDQYTPLDIEIYEPARSDLGPTIPVKPLYVRINGMDILMPEDADIEINGLADRHECATVRMTMFVRSVKVFREDAAPADSEAVFLDKELAEPLPEPKPVVDAHTATVEELSKALNERGWRLADRYEADVNPNITIPSVTFPTLAPLPKYQWLQQTWNDAGVHASNINGWPIQTITVRGKRQTGKTQRVIDEMIKHAQEGLQVVYVTHTMRQAAQVHEDIDRRNPDGLKASYRAHGAERVHFEGGGTIRFFAKTNTFRGMNFDVLVWDDVQKPLPEDVGFCLSRSKAPRIYEITAIDEGS